jgi:hypothetical protein
LSVMTVLKRRSPEMAISSRRRGRRRRREWEYRVIAER